MKGDLESIPIMGRFIQKTVPDKWQSRCWELLKILQNENYKENYNGIEPVLLANKTLAIGTNHRRRKPLIFLNFLILLLALFIFYKTGLPMLKQIFNNAPVDHSELLNVAILDSFFLGLSLWGFNVTLFKSPTADSMLLADKQEGIAIWRSFWRNRTRMALLNWKDHAIDITFETISKYNIDLHSPVVWRVNKKNKKRRQEVFRVRVDDEVMTYWTQYIDQLSTMVPEATSTVLDEFIK
jgi:hypothetical protein